MDHVEFERCMRNLFAQHSTQQTDTSGFMQEPPFDYDEIFRYYSNQFTMRVPSNRLDRAIARDPMLPEGDAPKSAATGTILIHGVRYAYDDNGPDGFRWVGVPPECPVCAHQRPRMYVDSSDRVRCAECMDDWASFDDRRLL